MNLNFLDSLKSFVNSVAGLGTSQDKASHGRYVDVQLTAEEIITAYRMSGIAKTIIDRPAREAFRNWRQWQSDTEIVGKIEREEKRLGLKHKYVSLSRRARLLGGGAIYISTGESDVSKPLDPSRIGVGGIKNLVLLGRNEVHPGPRDADPESGYFGGPAYFTMPGSVTVHPSRLVIRKGPDVPDEMIDAAMGFWGDSVLNSTLASISRVDTVAAGIASLVLEAKIDILKVPNLLDRLAGPDGEKFEEALLRRVRFSNTAKSMVNAMILDTNEEHEQRTYNFAGLPQIGETVMTLVSAHTGIPATIIFGKSPDGMNATGESDMENWKDVCSSVQEETEEASTILDECLVRSAIGEYPDDMHYTWRSLRQMSESQKSEVGAKNAESLKKIHDMRLLPDRVMQETIVSVMTESGTMPGMESALLDYYEENPELSEGEDLGTTPANPPAPPSGDTTVESEDARPMTLYMRRDVLNYEDILAWATEQGIDDLVDGPSMHVTVAHSRKQIDWLKVGQPWEDEITVPAGGPRIVEQFGNYGVLLFASMTIQYRHEDAVEAGAEHDHAEYQPHISFRKSDKPLEIGGITPYQGKIVLGPEVFEEVKL